MTRFDLSCPVPDYATETIEIAHGGGGAMTKRLIDGLFRPIFGTGTDDFTHDGALLDPAGARLAFTTDTYVVRPLFFPGGDIGSLAVNGTINDLAMCGAEPIGLSVGMVLEEGLPIADLRRIAISMQQAAAAAGTRLVTGDTKVVERGKGDGIYINTAGVGRIIAPATIGPRSILPGDAVLLSGDIGRHGIAIMAVRESFGFEPEIRSDCAALIDPVRALLSAGIPIHCLRDLTRGGLASALVEIAETAELSIRLDDAAIAVSDPVRGACEILGLDPLYIANEGRFVAFVPAIAEAAALAILRSFSPDASLIGRVETAAGGREHVTLATVGGTRPLDLLSGEQLPRIC